MCCHKQLQLSRKHVLLLPAVVCKPKHSGCCGAAAGGLSRKPAQQHVSNKDESNSCTYGMTDCTTRQGGCRHTGCPAKQQLQAHNTPVGTFKAVHSQVVPDVVLTNQSIT